MMQTLAAVCITWGFFTRRFIHTRVVAAIVLYGTNPPWCNGCKARQATRPRRFQSRKGIRQKLWVEAPQPSVQSYRRTSQGFVAASGCAHGRSARCSRSL